MRAARGLDHIRDGQVVEPQPLLIDIDLVLGQLAADRDDLGDAGHRENLRPQVELAVRTELHRADGTVG